jgi:type IV pilus biogenesis protein PilP
MSTNNSLVTHSFVLAVCSFFLLLTVSPGWSLEASMSDDEFLRELEKKQRQLQKLRLQVQIWNQRAELKKAKQELQGKTDASSGTGPAAILQQLASAKGKSSKSNLKLAKILGSSSGNAGQTQSFFLLSVTGLGDTLTATVFDHGSLTDVVEGDSLRKDRTVKKITPRKIVVNDQEENESQTYWLEAVKGLGTSQSSKSRTANKVPQSVRNKAAKSNN